MKWLLIMSMFLDINGLIVQRDMDGGDTAGREGDYWFAHVLNNESLDLVRFNKNLQLLQVEPGVFIRNPINYNDPKDFSRDQTVPLILAMGEMKEYGTLKLLFKKQLLNFGRYQNGDIGLIGDLGYYIRAFKMWYLYPILILGDAQLLVNSIIRCIKGRNYDDVSDDINHTLGLLQAQNTYPTPVSWLARKVYKHFRPGGIQRAWDWYFRPDSGANPFNEMYRNLIDKM